MSSTFQCQSKIHVQCKTHISTVIGNNLLSQLHSLSLHIMENKSPLWRDLRSQLQLRNLYKYLWEAIEKEDFWKREKRIHTRVLERREKTLFNLLSSSFYFQSLWYFNHCLRLIPFQWAINERKKIKLQIQFINRKQESLSTATSITWH